jgi:hypothetical protein
METMIYSYSRLDIKALFPSFTGSIPSEIGVLTTFTRLSCFPIALRDPFQVKSVLLRNLKGSLFLQTAEWCPFQVNQKEVIMKSIVIFGIITAK